MSLSATQVAERMNGIGGSEAAAAVNLSPWKSPLRLWQEKVGEIQPDFDPDNDYVRFGNLLEDIVADEFARRRGLRVQRDNRTLRHPEHAFMLGHIDRRIVGAREGLECKTASLRMAKEWGEENTDEVPIDYLAQAAHYMALTEFDVWHIAVLIAGNDFRMYRIERDQDLIDSLVQREAEFWNRVQTRTPPEPTTIEDAFSRWPQDNGKQKVASTEIWNDAITLKAQKKQAKDLAEIIEAHELRIKNFMQDATTLLAGDNKPLCTWKTQSANRIDVTRLREERPEIAEKFTNTSQSRVFRLK